jgi:NADH:ubiquinone oxidoreductase subunit
MSLLSQIFTWWNGTTLGTRLWTARHGDLVGRDEMGNTFYQTADGRKRWVIYSGEAEASRVSPDWHGWLHHTFDDAPDGGHLPRKPWERDHRPNLTGTEGAYHPPGSIVLPAERNRARGDYEPWLPE